ncbi:MAG: hypothetical protein HYU97_03855 [Deltaproteobacteria bacterium]|nr:hypothetical protein [Deltaproteobacteria bacterium]
MPKKTKPANSIQTTLKQINKVIAKFELEAEKVLKRLVTQGRRSRQELRRNFEDLFAKIKGGNFGLNTKGVEIEKEVRRLADEVLSRFKDIEFLPQSEAVTKVFADIRKNLASFVEVLRENGLVEKAKHLVEEARENILVSLSIPTQRDVEKLERKITTLEKRLSTLVKKAA